MSLGADHTRTVFPVGQEALKSHLSTVQVVSVPFAPLIRRRIRVCELIEQTDRQRAADTGFMPVP